MVQDLARTSLVRAAAGGPGPTVQALTSHLPRIWVAGAVVSLIAGVLGIPEAEPAPAEAQSASDIGYVYDALGRLRAVIDPAGATSYTYDPVGNRLTRTRNSTSQISYAYDKADRITSAGATGYTVDAVAT